MFRLFEFGDWWLETGLMLGWLGGCRECCCYRARDACTRDDRLILPELVTARLLTGYDCTSFFFFWSLEMSKEMSTAYNTLVFCPTYLILSSCFWKTSNSIYGHVTT